MTGPGRPGVFGATLADDDFHTSLIESLRFAVPLYLDQLRNTRPQDLPLVATRSARIVGERGDMLQFSSRKARTATQRTSAALAFEGLARGLAAITLLEGHMTFAGLHWCTAPHPDCPTPPRTPGPAMSEADVVRAPAPKPHPQPGGQR